MDDLAIVDARVVTPEGVAQANVAVHAGKIVAVGHEERPAHRVIDATDKWVMPGGVDVHAHIEQMSGMGLMNADTFETASKSAAMGGTTSVISFAAQARGQRLRYAVEDYAARARRGAMIDHAFHIIVSDVQVPHFRDDLIALVEAGHRSIKIFTTYDIRLDDTQILEIMCIVKQAGGLVCVHAENDAIISRARQSLIDAGQVTPADHAKSRPRMAEIEAVSRMCHLAEHVRQPLMLFHISTREAVDLVRAARLRGAPVWAETCPHYLMMTDEVLTRPHGAKWMCSPPQRTTEDQQALWQALRVGDLQLVSSDHAPYRYDATGKLAAGQDAGFHQIANGLPGLETRLPLMFDAMVSRGFGGPEAFVRLTSSVPAEIYGLHNKGSIALGKDADLVIWDPDRQVTYGENDLHDNVGYNPWEGTCVTGWPETVILRGELVVDQGNFLGQPGQGQWIPRPDASRFEHVV